MDDLNRSISNYVKSGEYYLHARKWYANKFIFVISQRTYIIFIASFFVTSLAILAFYYQATNPAAPDITYISPSPDIAKSYSVIFPAGESTDHPQIQITKYMLSMYIRKREAYQFGGIKEQLDFVRNTTVGTEYLKYEQNMSINNPASPLMLYQDANVKEVKIKDVKLLEPIDGQLQAVVSFVSSLRNLATNQVDSQDMVALIKFKIDNIEQLMDNNSKKLGFLVISYSLRQDKKS